MFFVINPVSGSKSSEKLFEFQILPTLSKDKIQHKTLITESINHLQTFIKNEFDTSSRVVATISGDGTVFHVVNALYQSNLGSIPLMIFPGGTDNGLYASLSLSVKSGSLQQYVQNCFTAYSKEKTKNMNCLSVKLCHSGLDLISMLSISFGMFTDIDLMSKYPRTLTIPLSALRLIVSNPYKNDEYRIYYKPAFPDKPLKPYFENLKASDKPEGWELLVDKFAVVIVCAHSHIGKISCLLPGFSSFSGNALLVSLFYYYQFLISVNGLIDKIKYLLNSEHPDMSCYSQIEVIEVTSFKIVPPKRIEKFTIDGEVFESQTVEGDIASHCVYI